MNQEQSGVAVLSSGLPVRLLTRARARLAFALLSHRSSCMTAAQDFQADPLDFLKHNLLLVQFSELQNGYDNKGPHYFQLEDYAGVYQCRTAKLFGNHDVPVYAIV